MLNKYDNHEKLIKWFVARTFGFMQYTMFKIFFFLFLPQWPLKYPNT